MLILPEEFVYKNDAACYDKGKFYVEGKFGEINAVAMILPQPIFEYTSEIQVKPPEGSNVLFFYLGSDYICTITEVLSIGWSSTEQRLKYFSFDGECSRSLLGYRFFGGTRNGILKYKYDDNFDYSDISNVLIKRVRKFDDCITLEGIVVEEDKALEREFNKK